MKNNKAFQKRNAAFKAATKAQKRVMIAKDALAQLRAKKITAAEGYYLHIEGAVGLTPERQVCDIIQDNKCMTCAYGGLMLSEIRHTNDLKVEECSEIIDEIDIPGKRVDLDKGGVGDRLEKYFSYSQLRLIEFAFEGWCDVFNEFKSDPQEFYDRYNSPDKRLAAILQNIVDNKGTFILPKK